MQRSSAGRRQDILKHLIARGGCATGADLAQQFGVTRQVIVRDMAILRAQGEPILATPDGYLWHGRHRQTRVDLPSRVIAVCHASTDLATELNTVVDLGATMVDVSVDHPVYGEVRGNLMISTRADVQHFLQRLAAYKAEPLLVLTGGVHLHTIAAPSIDVLDAVSAALQNLGILMSADDSQSPTTLQQ